LLPLAGRPRGLSYKNSAPPPDFQDRGNLPSAQAKEDKNLSPYTTFLTIFVQLVYPPGVEIYKSFNSGYNYYG